MFKQIFTILIIFVISLMTTSLVYASTLSVRIQSPQTPTNQNTFKINFVAMDLSGSGDTIEVKCFKTGDATPFSTINLSAGGNTGNCEVTSSIISTVGTYGFYVTATAGGVTETSPTVNVEYKTDSPSTPGSYTKQQLGSCQYKITFKTADDGGKTSRVEIYRSDQTSFTADGGSRVGTVWIGSNLEGSFIDNVPDCSKTYYYVIRAFDGAGNGSGVTGDSITKVILTSTTTNASQTAPAPTSGGAIPVSSSSAGEGGQVLGTDNKEATPEGEILGEGTPSSEEAGPSETVTSEGGIFSFRNILLSFAVIIAGGGYFLYRRFKS